MKCPWRMIRSEKLTGLIEKVKLFIVEHETVLIDR